MGRTPKPDAHRTGLQRRLADEVRAGMESTGRNQAELSRLTGIGEPHISLLLRGLRQGTISAWDKLLNAAHMRGDQWKNLTRVIVPPNPLLEDIAALPDVEGIAVEALRSVGVPVIAETIEEMRGGFDRHRPHPITVPSNDQDGRALKPRPAASLNPRRPL